MPKQYHCFLKQDSFDLQRPHMLCLEATKQALADCFANIQSYKQQSCTQFGCPFSNGKNHLLQQILGLTTWSSRERHLTSAKPSSSRWKNLWRPYQPSSNSSPSSVKSGMLTQWRPCWSPCSIPEMQAIQKTVTDAEMIVGSYERRWGPRPLTLDMKHMLNDR